MIKGGVTLTYLSSSSTFSSPAIKLRNLAVLLLTTKLEWAFFFWEFCLHRKYGYIFCCQEGFGKVGRRQELVCLFLAPLLSLPRWSDNAIVLHSSLLMVCNPGFASHDSNMLIILWPLYSLVISEHKKLQVLMTNYNQSVGHPLLDIFDQWH